MSKYCVSGTCCQNKELNSLSHHSCYLLAPVADYDGSTLMSEMMMLVMMAIVVTLTTTGMTSSAKTSEAFLRIFIGWYAWRTLCAHFYAHIEKNTLLLLMQASTSHLVMKQGLVLGYERSRP